MDQQLERQNQSEGGQAIEAESVHATPANSGGKDVIPGEAFEPMNERLLLPEHLKRGETDPLSPADVAVSNSPVLSVKEADVRELSDHPRFNKESRERTKRRAPAWFAKIQNKERITPAQTLSQEIWLEDIINADLSELDIRGEYSGRVLDQYDGRLTKHERRKRSHLLSLIDEVGGEQTRARAEVLGLEPKGIDEEGRGFLVTGFHDGEPQYRYTMNESAADSSAASYVRQNTSFDPVFGPDIDGSGFFFNINDHGVARQHLEFQLPNNGGSRVIEREVPDNDGHMDHVTGTVGAHGYRVDAKGMAPAVMMYSLNQQSNSDVDLLGAQYPFQPRRSIGGTTSLGWDHDTGEGGIYDSSARDMDDSLLKNPYYLHFYAAANNGGWDTVSRGRQMSKNLITVASGKHVTRDANGNFVSGGNRSGFSSRGPADDGRIKPDVTANGEGVLSTTGTTGYGTKQGTSMATPNASGSSILLQDYFSKRFPGHLMQSMTLKNLILHTADDKGDTGPDYEYGWGFMNTRKAADLIKSYADNPGNQRILEGVLRNGETHTYTYTWDGSNALVANLTWLDKKGTSSSSNDNRVPDLVYDLDLRVESPSSTTYLPWAMPFVLNNFDTADWGTPATKADNTTDNVEQVRIGSPTQAGVYTVTVSHKGSIPGAEEVRYSLIMSGVDTGASAPAPTISSFTPSEGTHDKTIVTVSGSGFLFGANVSLQALGLPTVEGEAEKVTPSEIEVFLPLDRVAAGDYKLVVSNPDGQSVSSTGDFVVTAYEDLLFEDFDAPGMPSGWTSDADTGTNDWTISTTEAVSGNSAHVPTRTEEVHSYLESPPIVVPNTNSPIKLSFQHKWDLEIELAEYWYSSHDAEDGALLMVSVDGGAFEHVDQSFSASADGAEIVSGDYWDNLDSSNPARYSSYTTYGWTDESGGWQRTNVMLESATYKNKTLRFRWVLGTQNSGSDNVEGWWIDNVSLSVKDSNVLPQVATTPSLQATAGQAYSEGISFTDEDGDSLTLTAVTKPAWLSFIDNGNRNGTLSANPTGSHVGTHGVIIEADDGTGTRSYSYSLVVMPAGGNNAPTFTTVALDPAITETPYTFDVQAADVDGHSLTLSVEGLPSWLSFTDNQNGMGTLTGTPNSYAEGSINLTMYASDGADTVAEGFTLQILPPAQLAFSTGSTSVGEGAGSIILTVNRTLNPIGGISVDYTTVADSATAGQDYTTTSGTLTWPDGDSAPKTIEVPILEDVVYNEVESFDVRLSNPTGGSVLGSVDEVTVTIDENDLNTPPLITLNSPVSNIVAIPSGVGLIIETTVTDDGFIAPFTLQWSKVSGPGNVIFGNATAEDTTLVFDADGTYVLRLTADDSQDTSELEVTVEVGATTGEPTADVPTADLVGFWAFNGNANDSSGNNYNGSYKEGASSGTGRFGQGVVLDGSNDYVDLNAPSLINYGAPIQKRSVAVWFKPTDISKAGRQLIFEEGGTSRGFSAYIKSGTLYVGGYESNTSWNGPWVTSTAITSGEWHHVAWTLDGDGTLTADLFIVYLNGVEIGRTVGSQLSDHSGENSVGAVNSNTKFDDGSAGSTKSDPFQGTIDHLVIYNRVLSPADVLSFVEGNIAPDVDAGDPDTGPIVQDLPLNGTVSDDGKPSVPGTVTITWSQLDGPGTATFGNISDVDTTVSFDTVGEYVLRVSADDGNVVVFDDVSFTAIASGPGVLLTESGGNTVAAEGGASDTYSLVLTEQPDSNVVLTLTPDGQQTVNPSSLTFTTGNWDSAQTITVTAVDDALDEGAHSGLISHSASSSDLDYDGMSIDDISVSIVDNDQTGQIQFTQHSWTVDEGVGTLQVVLTRSGGQAGAASVELSTVNGSATAGSDFTVLNSQTVSWLDGEGGDKTVDLTITDDTTPEATENLQVQLSNVTGAQQGSPLLATVIITDNESFSYLLNFGENAYTTDGTSTWQTFDLCTTGEGGTGDPVAVAETTLKNTDNSTAEGITFEVDISGTNGTGVVGYQTSANVLESFFSANPFTWFTPSVAQQRETFSIKSGSGSYVYTFKGFNATDQVEFEFVLARPSTGDRATTITHQNPGDVLNDGQVDTDGGPQYPTITLTGATEYSFTIFPSGSSWGCLPNAIGVHVTPQIAPSTPAAPSGLLAQATSSTSIQLSWTDNSSDETGFLIQRSTTGGGAGFSTIQTVPAGSTSYSDGSLTADSTLYYRVVATNSGEESPASNESNATTWTLQQQYFEDAGIGFDANPTEDDDNDGVSNEDEFIAGTDPYSSSSMFTVNMASAAGSMWLQTPTVSGKYYRVTWRASLDAGSWSVVNPYDGTTQSTGLALNVEATSEGFYRIEVSTQSW